MRAVVRSSSQEPETRGKGRALATRGLLAILCVAGTGCFHCRPLCAQVPWEERFQVRTEHFHVQCNVSLEQAARYARLLEAIRARLAEVFPTPPALQLRAAPVHIHSSRREFLENAPLARGRAPAVAGYYRPRDGSITTYHGDPGFTVTTFGVLCHEVTHYYQELVLGDLTRVPGWLLEGLAIYLAEGSAYDTKRERLSVGKIPRRRLTHIQEKMLVGDHLPVDRLARREPAGHELPAAHHADAWALVYFLVNSGKPAERFLTDYWRIGLRRNVQDDDLVRLVKKHFRSFAEMERQYTAFILDLELPPAGRVIAGRFVSSTFGLRLEPPGKGWVFFEDPADWQLLTGLRRRGASVEIRVRLEDNPHGLEGEAGLRRYLRHLSPAAAAWQKQRMRISGRQALRLTSPKQPAVKYVIVGVDGILTVDCRAQDDDGQRWAQIFAWVPEGLTFPPMRAP